jgi:hypothetical protein
MEPRTKKRVFPVLIVGGLAAGAWACGGTGNDEGDATSEGATESSVGDGGGDAGHDASVDGEHKDAHHDAQHDRGADAPPVDGGEDVLDAKADAHDAKADVHDSGPDVHDSSADAHDSSADAHDSAPDVTTDSPPDSPADSPVDSPPDSPPFDAGPPLEAGVPVILATGESPVVLAVDDTYVYWENSTDAVLDCPVAGCPGNIPTILAFNGSGYGLEAMTVGLGTAFYLSSSSSIDSCTGGGCGLAPSDYYGGSTIDSGYYYGAYYTSIISDSANAYFLDGTNVYSCPLGTSCSSPTTLYTSSGAYITTLAVSASEVFFVRQGSVYDTLLAVPIGGGTSRAVCVTSSLGGVEGMVAGGSYIYFTTYNAPLSIVQCPIAGGKALVYAKDVAPYGLAADDSYLYWTNNTTSGTVKACALGASCTTASTVASGQPYPQAIAVNSTSIFWATTSEIYSATK